MKKVLVTGILITALCIAGCGGPVDNIKDATGLSKEQSQQVLTELQSVGVTEFGNVNKVADQQGVYYIVDEKYGQTFFRIKNGQKMNDISNVYISDQQKAAYQVAAKDAVSARLKAPSTAKFDIKKVIRYDNSVTVRGTVDAQNGFGAMVRGMFFVKIKADTGEVDSVSINNL